MPSLRQVVQGTHGILEGFLIPEARLEAEVMVLNIMRMLRQDLFSNQEMEVSPQQEQQLAEIIERRQRREPLAYILGYKEFYGINLLVNSDVLIPRPETESMVEHALFMALMGMETAELVIADVGTGTGAIAINLAIHLPAAHIFATDLSDQVLDVASYNVHAHNVADRITLLKGDLLEPLPQPVDLIVANMPYVPSQRIPTLQPGDSVGAPAGVRRRRGWTGPDPPLAGTGGGFAVGRLQHGSAETPRHHPFGTGPGTGA